MSKLKRFLSCSAAAAAVAALAMPGMARAAQEQAVQLYKNSCMVCHASGMAGAPRLGDKARWESLQQKGMDAMMQVVIHGKGAMPPRGGAMQASDQALKDVVIYMIEKSR